MLFDLICEWCGKPFKAKKKTTNKGKVNTPRRFCNKSCSAKWRMSRPEYVASLVTEKVRARGRIHMLEIRSRPEVQEKLRVHLTEGNPFRDPAVRRKSLLVRARDGFRNLNGGNGKPIPVPARVLSERLGWPTEVVVSCGPRAHAVGRPQHYKIDIAEVGLRIAIEVDGQSHRAAQVKEADRRKDEFLMSQGWAVLRFSNSRVLTDFENVVKEIQAVMAARSSGEGTA